MIKTVFYILIRICAFVIGVLLFYTIFRDLGWIR